MKHDPKSQHVEYVTNIVYKCISISSLPGGEFIQGYRSLCSQCHSVFRGPKVFFFNYYLNFFIFEALMDSEITSILCGIL